MRACPIIAACALMTSAHAQERPAASLERMSWNESCTAIHAHLQTALQANEAIAADVRTTIAERLAAGLAQAGDRSACLGELKEAYDQLAAAYGRTAPSANVLGGATTAPADPAAAVPERVEGQRTGERIGENPRAFD
jgi:hypothetical protein